MFIIVGTLGSTLASNTVSGLGVLGMLGFWRVVLGFGIGGDYPLSAVITSEFSASHRRGAMISAVFAMQGIGILAASLFTTITLAAYKSVLIRDPLQLDSVWRIIIGLGGVPAVLTLYFRLTFPESPRYNVQTGQTAVTAETLAKVVGKEKAAETLELKDFESGSMVTASNSNTMTNPPTLKKRESFWSYWGQWRHGKVLLGTSLSWFFLDVAFYGLGLNQSAIVGALGYGTQKGDSPFDTQWKSAIGNLLVALLGSVPGYWVTVFTVDRLGRKFIQLLGFSVLTICFLILSTAFHPLVNNALPAFIVIYTLAQFFFNFGPNTTTFVVPGEVFPTRWRTTAHGISAASGKAGAILAAQGFSVLKDIGGKNVFLPQLLGIFSAFMFAGLVSTFLIPETKGKSLEELGKEGEWAEEEVVEIEAMGVESLSSSQINVTTKHI